MRSRLFALTLAAVTGAAVVTLLGRKIDRLGIQMADQTQSILDRLQAEEDAADAAKAAIAGEFKALKDELAASGPNVDVAAVNAKLDELHGKIVGIDPGTGQPAGGTPAGGGAPSPPA